MLAPNQLLMTLIRVFVTWGVTKTHLQKNILCPSELPLIFFYFTVQFAAIIHLQILSQNQLVLFLTYMLYTPSS
jgi:hypothetical protein